MTDNKFEIGDLVRINGENNTHNGFFGKVVEKNVTFSRVTLMDPRFDYCTGQTTSTFVYNNAKLTSIKDEVIEVGDIVMVVDEAEVYWHGTKGQVISLNPKELTFIPDSDVFTNGMKIYPQYVINGASFTRKKFVKIQTSNSKKDKHDYSKLSNYGLF